ncbi:uncharacterized protein LOC106639604 [Copidosoma floridanum]|uniref:uncharacterized protein LOC106639604 n=1 Tax=Copidosoma floridanum TaxID=29053 RepID=UPI0006C968C4|nr:uncharacterized protein LOC106639604 [Copidosoma floridanum]
MHRQIRCLCTSVRLHSQMGRIVNKVFNSDLTKKSRNNKAYKPSVETFPSLFNKAQTHKSRRTTVLNKILMRHITDLMATGEVAPTLLGRGIEVTHVDVASDFSVVNVYWIAQNNNDANVTTDQVLKVAAGHLQHELSQLRVIGQVPPVNFVRNKIYNTIKEVEDRLKTVDFGEDFEPTAHIIPEDRTPILKTTLSEKVKQQIEELMKQQNSTDDAQENEETEEEDDNALEIQVPEMRQNVMGFDHSYVLAKVKTSLGKIKIAEERKKLNLPEFPQGSQVPKTESSNEVTDFLASSNGDLKIEKFIKKRLSDEKRKLKALPYEAKLEAEIEWIEKMGNKNTSDYYVDDVWEDDYRSKSNNK